MEYDPFIKSQLRALCGDNLAELDRVHRNVKRFRGGLVFKAHRLCVSLNSRLESNTEEEDRVVADHDVVHAVALLGVIKIMRPEVNSPDFRANSSTFGV